MKRPTALALFILLTSLPGSPYEAASGVSRRVSKPLSSGDTAVDDTSANAFGRALNNLDLANWPKLMDGKRVFLREWRPRGEGSPERDGLGPLFNQRSCVACHFKDGRGGRNGWEVMGTPPPFIFRLDSAMPSIGGRPRWGSQLQDQALGLLPEGLVKVSYREMAGRYPNGDSYSLRRPIYTVEGVKDQPPLSPRVPPTLVGLGLLEAVEDRFLLDWEDPQDADGDGISGRASWVPVTGKRELGRFGWKAARSTLPEQAAGALAEDMGISSRRYPLAGHPPMGSVEARPPTELDISDQDLERLVDYLRLLAPPARRRQGPEPTWGENLFRQVGCHGCHRPRLETGPPGRIAGPPELAGQVIYPFTDLLLHDLGEGLADDGIGETFAGRREWRTAPLWGLGLLDTVSGGTFLLHDGRARSFEEAILWHDGEAFAAREDFLNLEREEREALIGFLKSL